MTSTPSIDGSLSPLYSASMAASAPDVARRKWRVVIAARHSEGSAYIHSALRNCEQIHSVGQISPPAKHTAELVAGNPDLLLVHDEMLEHRVEPHVRRILQQRPGVRLLVFGAGMSDDRLLELAGAGVHGYLNGRPDAEEIRLALGSLMAGNTWIEHRILARHLSSAVSAETLLTTRLQENIDRLCSELTRREKEILCQVVRGYAIKQIAAEVHLSHQGVKMHLARLFRKFGASNRNQLILAVLGTISPVHDLPLCLCRELRRVLSETKD